MLGFDLPGPRRGLHPLAALGLAVVGLSFGLTLGTVSRMGVYVASLTLLVLSLGYFRPWAAVHKFVLPAGLAVGLLTWLITGSAPSGGQVLLRFLLFGLTTSLVVAVDPSELARALNRIHCPRRISLGFLITVRFIPVLKSEMERIMEAVRARGAKPARFNFGRSYRLVLLPLVVRLINISDTLALSLETRAFSTAGRPTSYRRTPFSPRDLAAVSAAVLIIAGMLWWRIR